ncbi:putative membrane protein YeiH [Sinobacterium caligoides]|uniref:Putative membrane protein YeiH n=1 Tax=Sinobacterium caligoides TaxID=933926 RepID=A0A3N2E0M4_9GAMM|nr:trimeric intracellular cation channel family protein [Sinobacterium caligoides]ROS05660.1 putative membrane protein YeiH [Sinobacterium caligoides]
MFLTYIYLIAITAEAMSGALVAGRRNMDIFGVSVIAFVTALGGGTIRDILLGHFPIAWTQHPPYIYLTVGAGLLTIVVAKYMVHLRKVFLVLDALGLIAFTIIGCDVAQQLGYHTEVVVMSGMITGICGGVLRDLLCQRTPVVFCKEIYAGISLLVAIMYVGFHYLGIEQNLALAVIFVTGLTLRICAIYWRWSLPIFCYSSDEWD